ncbi:hypothetical protein E3N88_16768 [Mikania micrantha]|uniref:CCHC-type domain-containing protein n=1 Tax=Mikania micrantha TaxID=192012 RepID=A0A5N6NPV6_9ASTR|nr:hypothetical protein E3N88_16768 [Mikania micrantha]
MGFLGNTRRIFAEDSLKNSSKDLGKTRWSDCGCESCVSWMNNGGDQKLHVVVKNPSKENQDFDETSTENVIFLHGFMSSSYIWTETVFPELVGSKHRLFAVDILGFGSSPKPRECLYTLDDHLEMVIKSVIHEFDLKSFHLVAHSMGCIIALALAAKHPNSVKSITLVAPPYFLSSEEQDASQIALKRLAYKSVWPPLLFGSAFMTWYEHLGRCVCFVVCRNHRTWERILMLMTRKRKVNFMMMDLFRHTHHSAWHTMHNVICGGAKMMDPCLEILRRVQARVTVVQGSRDKVVPLECSNNIKVKVPDAEIHGLGVNRFSGHCRSFWNWSLKEHFWEHARRSIMAGETGNYQVLSVPKFDGDYEHWSLLMKTLLRSKEYWSVIDPGFTEPREGVELMAAQRTDLETMRLEGLKAQNYLFQSIDKQIVKTMTHKETAKQIWDAMKNKYQGNARVKKEQLQRLRRDFEILEMKEGESVTDYVGRVMITANEMRNFGEEMTDVKIVEKVLRSLTEGFTYVVCSIEESKDTDEMSVDELQSSLLGRGETRPDFDKSAVECYKCHLLGHFAYECPRDGNSINYMEFDEGEELLLMANSQVQRDCKDEANSKKKESQPSLDAMRAGAHQQQGPENHAISTPGKAGCISYQRKVKALKHSRSLELWWKMKPDEGSSALEVTEKGSSPLMNSTLTVKTQESKGN